MKALVAILCCAVLAGCASGPGGLFSPRASQGAPVVRDGSALTHPPARPASPPAGARTAEALDTTTARERARAVADAADSGGETDLGLTVASLGAVGEPGIWLKTPLVRTPAKGRIAYPAAGTAVAVDLMPLDAAPGAGSQISLAAMRLIGADLTALPELRVYRLD